jgi:hypothetical protein
MVRVGCSFVVDNVGIEAHSADAQECTIVTFAWSAVEAEIIWLVAVEKRSILEWFTSMWVRTNTHCVPVLLS